MSYARARDIIWAPDEHTLEEVAEASMTVLKTPGAGSLDAFQASYLLTTYKHLAE